jgi:hypothetical protein
MQLFGKRRKRKPECSTKPRKRKAPTKAEARLAKRIASYNATMRLNLRKPMGPETNGYRRPGSLKTT